MTEPLQSEPDLVVLHTLRCAGAASTERLVAMIEPHIDADVEDTLLSLGGRGLVSHSSGGFGGWRLTEAGKAADAEQIASELEQSQARPDVHAAYEQFMTLNQRTLDICSDWQVRRYEPPMVMNDHADRAYDASVLKRLEATNAEAQTICERLAARLQRFAQYGLRLNSALQRARNGELDMVADSLDSYHTVWFQLHEDLLATLGLTRQ